MNKIPAKKPAPRRVPASPAPQAAPAPAAYVIEAPSIDFDGPIGTEIFDTLAKVRALPVEASSALSKQSLQKARGYDKGDLFALAEIGHHYLFSGGLRIAFTIFEGLAAIAPEEPYFALALGLACDRLDRVEEANDAYRRAALLDKQDPRPELNLAELALSRGDRAEARARLIKAIDKARDKNDLALFQKAEAIFSRIGGKK